MSVGSGSVQVGRPVRCPPEAETAGAGLTVLYCWYLLYWLQQVGLLYNDIAAGWAVPPGLWQLERALWRGGEKALSKSRLPDSTPVMVAVRYWCLAVAGCIGELYHCADYIAELVSLIFLSY